MYIVTRQYRLAEESLKEVVSKTEEGGLSLFRKIPGFIDYYYIYSDGSVMTIGIDENRESAEESTRIAADWVPKNIPGLYAGPPKVFSGDVLIHSREKKQRGEAA
jgi:hypothetical protein